MRFHRVVAVILSIASGLSMAGQDVVNVKFHPGHPAPGASLESWHYEIRRTSFGGTDQRAIDRYFDDVSSILKRHQISRNWANVTPDLPYIKVTITRDDQTITLTSSYSQESGKRSSTSNRNAGNNEMALKKIMKLCSDYMRQRFDSDTNNH